MYIYMKIENIFFFETTNVKLQFHKKGPNFFFLKLFLIYFFFSCLEIIFFWLSVFYSEKKNYPRLILIKNIHFECSRAKIISIKYVYWIFTTIWVLNYYFSFCLIILFFYNIYIQLVPAFANFANFVNRI